MKKIILLLISIFLVTTLFAEDNSDLNSKLNFLKSKALENTSPEVRSFITGEQQGKRMKLGEDSQEAEIDEDGDYVFDVLDYVSKMNEQYPDVMDDYRKDKLMHYLENIEQVYRESANVRNVDASVVNEEIAEEVATMVEEVLMPETDTTIRDAYIEDTDAREEESAGEDQEITESETRVEKVILQVTPKKGANIRKGPSTSYGVVASSSYKTRLELIEIKGDWYYVKLNSRIKGYISKSVVQVVQGDINNIVDSDDEINTTTENKSGVINVAYANIRKGPGTNHDIAGILSYNDKVTVLGTENNWYKIQTAAGLEAYISSKLVTLTTTQNNEENLDIAVVRVNLANLRSGPGTNYSKIASLKLGDKVSIISDSGQWYFVKLSNGKKAYIYKNLVFVDNASNERARVIVEKARVRSGRSTRYKTIRLLDRGDIVSVLDYSNSWYHVMMEDGKRGYMYKTLIKKINTSSDSDTDNSTDNNTNDDTDNNTSNDSNDNSNDPGTTEKKGYISVSNANIRKGPGTNYSKVASLTSGTQVTILEENDGWYKIKLPNGTTGYIFNTLITTDRKAYISVSRANIRKGPGTNYSKVTSLTSGTQVTILEENGEWYKIKLPNGSTGYIFNSLVTTTDASAPLGSKAQRVVSSALGVVNKSDVLYGQDCYNASTDWGNLACAAVVSAILKHADVGFKQTKLYCPYMENYLLQIGFTRVSSKSYRKGDVCFWSKYSGDRARHVGVVVSKDVYGKWWVVDNSSSKKRVLKRPLIRSYYPIVRPGRRP